MRMVILTALVLGLFEIGIGLLSYRDDASLARAERSAQTGGSAMGRARDDNLWRAHLDVVDRELARGHIDVAVRIWHDAQGAALASRTWESMIALGDSWMAIGRAAGTPRGSRERAREAYTTALIWARRSRSVEGVLGS